MRSPMLRRRVVVTGLGAVTPLGVGARRTWSRILSGDSGLASLLDHPEAARFRGLPCVVAGLVPRGDGDGQWRTDGQWRANDWVPGPQRRRMSLFTQYAVAAAEMALEDAGWRPTTDAEREDAGVCLGTGIGNLDDMFRTSVEYEKAGYNHKKVSPLFVPVLLSNMAAGHLSMIHGLRGPCHTATTACTTGAHSVGDAARFIGCGDAVAMLAGGSEACIHPLTFAGFAQARSLHTLHNHDPASSCRPFDSGRAGFIVAEGAAVLLLEEFEHARLRGARVYAEVRGYGCSADAYHMTAPREDGSGALLSMRRALRDAGLGPAEVGYINAHATGTRVGDAAEALAIRRLMLEDPDGGGVDHPGQVTVSSTKGATGHLLGAAGALEAMFCALAVAEDVVPPTLNLVDPDVGVDFNFVRFKAQRRSVEVAMTNSFGFGGANCSLVFSKLR